MLTSGQSLRLVRQCSEQNGLEAYRLLCKRWNPSTRGRSLGKLAQLITWDFGSSKEAMMDRLALFESATDEWERLSRERLSDSVKCAILCERSPQAVAQLSHGAHIR
eukprot:2609006-Amphidinium_carterae.4